MSAGGDHQSPDQNHPASRRFSAAPDAGTDGGGGGSVGAEPAARMGHGGIVGTGGTVGAGGIVGTGGVVLIGGIIGTGGVVGTGGIVGTGGSDWAPAAVLGTGGIVGTGGVVGTGGTGRDRGRRVEEVGSAERAPGAGRSLRWGRRPGSAAARSTTTRATARATPRSGTWPSPRTAPGWSPGGGDGRVKVWSFDGSKLTATGQVFSVPGYGFAAFSPDGQHLAIGRLRDDWRLHRRDVGGGNRAHDWRRGVWRRLRSGLPTRRQRRSVRASMFTRWGPPLPVATVGRAEQRCPGWRCRKRRSPGRLADRRSPDTDATGDVYSDAGPRHPGRPSPCCRSRRRTAPSRLLSAAVSPSGTLLALGDYYRARLAVELPDRLGHPPDHRRR